jgi:hypothetical protein
LTPLARSDLKGGIEIWNKEFFVFVIVVLTLTTSIESQDAHAGSGYQAHIENVVTNVFKLKNLEMQLIWGHFCQRLTTQSMLTIFSGLIKNKPVY